MTPLQAALQLAEELGYPVFPCGENKAPLTEHGFKDASANRDQIVAWWEKYPDALIGVPTGTVTNLFVIDVDPDGMSWLEQHRDQFLSCTRVHETRRHGRHLFYAMPAEGGTNSASKIAPGVDTRGEGGFVVWWPAAGYRCWLNGKEEAPPPVEVPKNAPVQQAGGNGHKRARHKEGGRHAALIRMAAHLRRSGVEGKPFEAALIEWNKENCNPPQDEADVLRIARDYLQKPEDKELEAAHADAAKTNLHILNALDEMTVAVKTPIVSDLLYPGAYLLTGRPKIGKSWMLLQLALAVAEADTFLGFHCNKGDVLAIFAEDDDGRLQKRLRALGVMKTPSIFYVNREHLVTLAQQFAQRLTFTQWLDDWLAAHPQVKLVLCDTETTVLQMWTGECESAHIRVTHADYRQTREFDEVALRRGVALILVNHASKIRGASWIDIHELINRSLTAVAGASGSIALAEPPDADPLMTDATTRVFGVRGRDLEHDVLLAVHQDKELPRFISDGPYREVVQSQAETEVLEALQQCSTPEEWVPAGDIGGLCGKAAKTVNRVLARMILKGRRRWKEYRLESKSGKGGGYRLDKVD